MLLSVIAPFLNEEENLASFLTRTCASLEDSGIDFEVVLVDDGSVDSSLAVVAAFTESNPNHRVRVVRHESNLGIFQAWLTGLRLAQGKLSILIDTDLQNPPEAIALLHRQFFASTCHFAQGYRSSVEFGSQSRLLLSRTLNTILNRTFRSRAADHKSGFILGPTTLFLDALPTLSGLRYAQTFVRAAIESRRYLVAEVETIFFPRRAGQSFLAGRLFAAVVGVIVEIPIAWARLQSVKRPGFMSDFEGRNRTPHHQTVSGPKQLLWRNLFFLTLPIHTWNISLKARQYLRVLEESDLFNREQIEEIRLLRLNHLLWHVFGRVPHYRKFFLERGMTPDDVQSIADLGNLPLLSKDELRKKLYFDMFSVGVNRRALHRISTSGSTGTPTVLYGDKDQLDVRFATTLRAQQNAGWKFGDRQIRLWHQNLGLSRRQELQERFNAAVSRRTFVPAFELDQAKVGQLIKKIEKIRPTLIDGYAESLNYLSQALEGKLLRHQPVAIMTSAQILSSQVRRAIENQFRAKVFDKYGSREFSGIAYECADGSGHHVQWESYIVEVLKDGRPALPGETGEIVITDLNNFSVPLIRYRIGDLGVAMVDAACSCGRASPRIGEIVGRTQALVFVDQGVCLPGTFFAHFFKEFDAIVRQFQVVQRELGRLTLKIVKGEHWSESAWQECIGELRRYTGDEIVLEWDFVSEIPLLRTGKRTPVVSSVRLDFQAGNSGSTLLKHPMPEG